MKHGAGGTAHPSWLGIVRFQKDRLSRVALAVVVGVCGLGRLPPPAVADEPKGLDILEMPEPVMGLAFTPNSQALITWSPAQVWNLKTGRLVAGPMSGPGVGLSLAVSPDGKRLLTGGFDGFARLWDVASGKPIGDPLECVPKRPGVRMGTRVEQVAFAPDGKTMATLSSTREFEPNPDPKKPIVPSAELVTGRRWDAITGRALGEPEAWPSRAIPHRGLEYPPLAFGRGGQLAPEDPEAHPPLRHPPKLSNAPGVVRVDDRPLCIAVSPDKTRALTGGVDGRVLIWDLKTRKTIGALEISAVDRTRLVESVREELGPEGQPLFERLKGNSPWVFALTFTPDGQRAVVGTTVYPDLAPRVWLWDLKAEKQLGEPLALPASDGKRRDGQVSHVAVSPDGRILAVTLTRRARAPGKPGSGEVHLWALP